MFAKWTAVHAWALCILSAGLYVGSMYVIPLRVRRLPRDNVVHVRNNLLTQLCANHYTYLILVIILD